MEGHEQSQKSEQRGPALTGPGRDRVPQGRRATLVIGLLALTFAGLFLFGYRHYLRRQSVVEAAAQSAHASLPTVNVTKVVRGATELELTLPGNISPVTEAYVYARAAGYVRQRYVDIGDRVSEAQLLAEIEAPELDQQVAQARATLAQANDQLDQAKADDVDARARLELARVTWDRFKALVDHGAISRQDGDQQLATFRSASAAVDSVAARIGSAKGNIVAVRANLDRLVAMQDFEKVRAPFSGVITARNFDVGALISATGSSLGQVPALGSGQSAASQGSELFRIARIDVLRVLINVPEKDAPGIRVGNEATVQAQAFSSRRFTGRITRTASAVDLSSRTMLTEVEVHNADFVLLPGMFVQVRLVSMRAQPPLLIPGAAVITTAKGLFVAVLEDLRTRELQSGAPDARRIHLQEIEAGRDYGQELEVLSGLQGWEYLVMNPGDEIEEGAIVLPVGGSKSEDAGGRSGNSAPTGGVPLPKSGKTQERR
jgi:RND family efflux transporter MFP subunit